MSFEDVVRSTREFLTGRKGSYCRVFNRESRDVQAVLADLAEFCRAHATTFDQDPRIHALAEGRREVFLRIAHHLELPDDELWLLYTQAPKRMHA